MAIIIGPALPPVVAAVFLDGEQSIGMALAWSMAGLGFIGAACLGFAIRGFIAASDEANALEGGLHPGLQGA